MLNSCGMAALRGKGNAKWRRNKTRSRPISSSSAPVRPAAPSPRGSVKILRPGAPFAAPSVNWCYETEPDPGAGDRRVFWPRGKVLGGSSSINGMVYIRGQAEDFDHWRQLGNTGWSFDDVLPYFKRAEHQTRGGDNFHGTR